MFCSVCGAQNPPQQRFCRSCGKPLSSAETLAADADDPLKTRLSIPTDQSAFKPQPSPPPPPQHVDIVDNMATVVGMPAVKAPTPGQNAGTPDPFATQVGGAGLNLNQLKELAAKSTAGKTPAPPSEPDNMATVVGMQAVKLPIGQSPSQSNDDAMKTVTGPSKGTPPAQSKEPVDNMATVVGMPAVSANMLPTKAPEAPKQPAPAPPKAPTPSKEISKPALPNPPSTKNNSPLNNVEQESSSNSTMLIMIGVVVVVIIIVAVVFLRK